MSAGKKAVVVFSLNKSSSMSNLFELPQHQAVATKGGLAVVPKVAKIKKTVSDSSNSESGLFSLLAAGTSFV